MNLAVAVPLTDTRSSLPVETDKVPAPAGAEDEDDDGDDGDEDEPAAGDGFVVAEAEPGAPGDRKASGAVVPPGIEGEGADPFPARPDGPPRAEDGPEVLTDAPWEDPPAAPADGGPWCDPARTPTAMAPATVTPVALPARTACRWCRRRTTARPRAV